MGYLSSIFGIFGEAGILLGIPWVAIWIRFPKLSRVTSLLGLLGFYTTLAYVKPPQLPLWSLPLFVIFASLALGWKERRKISDFFKPLENPAVCGILVYSFLLFLFRWEPPGTDPIKWGSLARLFFESGMIPGDTRPLTQVQDLKSASMGIPIPVALLHLGRWMPLERILNFFECTTIAIFCFSLIRALRLWFDENSSAWAVFLSLVFFTSIQGYLSWGGTPTLMGMTAGFLLLEWVKLSATQNKLWVEALLLASAFVYTVHAHPIGVYLSVMACAPIAFFIGLSHAKKVFPLMATVVVASLVLLIPFFLHLQLNASPGELVEVRHWQEKMSPFLFRSNYSWIYNMYTQLTAYLWNTAGIIGILVLVMAITSKTAPTSFSIAMVYVVGLVVLLVDNVHSWRLPLSYLLYPERSATLLLFPLAGGLAWLVNLSKLPLKNTARMTARVTLILIACLGIKQFKTRLLPYLGHSLMRIEDRIAIHEVTNLVPAEDCLRITPETASIWIPVLAFRCTIPFHGLAMNAIEQERKLQPAHTKWTFLTLGEKEHPSPGTVVFDNGARIINTGSH